MKILRYTHALLFVGALLLLASPTLAELTLSPVFSENAVVQRDKPVPVWGWTNAGDVVTVNFAGQSKKGTADEKGRWTVTLDKMSVNKKPQDLTVASGDEKITSKGILVGDVWICSGQSNMGRGVNRSIYPDDMPMDYPQLRCLCVRTKGTSYPLENGPMDWLVCTEENIPNTCAIGFFFARRVYEETGIPIGFVWSAWAGSTVNEWMPRFAWHMHPSLAEKSKEIDAWYPNTPVGREAWKTRLGEIEQWTDRAEKALAAGEPFPFPQPMMPAPPKERGDTCFYNGKIHPLVPMATKGILWYQGESDMRNTNYANMCECMVKSWRELLDPTDKTGSRMPFYFMQIQRSGDYCSPLVRAEQFQCLKQIPNSGMAVLMDLDVNVHPANKYDSGERLAFWALNRDYGKKDIIPSGPLYKKCTFKGNKAIIEFDHADGGLFLGEKDLLNAPVFQPGAELTNVKISADRRKWVTAKTKIDGERLVVWSDDVPEPIAVRYCYENIPAGPFLYNKAKLPAAQFTTDNWKK